jgi:AraC family transcriptional regulator, positive regulator of tynA and feaB
MTIRSSCRYDFISTDGLRPVERYAFWRDACLKRFEPLQPVGAAREAFGASIRRLSEPAGRLTDLCVKPTGIRRTARMCRADDIDDIVLGVEFGGSGAGWIGESDRTVLLASSEMRLFDYYSQPSVMQWSGVDHRALHIDLPRATFDSRTLSRILAGNGARLAPSGLAPMLAAQMRTLADIAPDLDPTARTAGLRSVLDLATTVLHLEFGSAPADSDVCEDGMFAAAQAFICRHFGSTDLTPEQIAHRLGCSRAHLYRVFARNGLTVAGYLRNIRLERCRAALVNAGPRETVGDIAFCCGFDNPVHFARLFHRRFGMRPTDARRRDGKLIAD